MNRRHLLIGGAATVAAAAAGIWALVHRGERTEISVAQTALLERVSDLAIPATDTPGALATQTPAFVALALKHGVAGLDVSALDRLASELAHAGGRAFAALDAAAQEAALKELDESAFARDATAGEAWRAIKSLIAIGYYTSEAGASQELGYELVPGRFDPDLPVAANTHAYSSDWTSVDFG